MKELLSPRNKTILKLAFGATLLTGCAEASSGQNPTLNPEIIPATATIGNPFKTEETATATFTPTGTLFPTETPAPVVPYRMFGVDFSDVSRKISLSLDLLNGRGFKFLPTTPTLDCDTKGGFAPKNLTSCEYQFWGNSEDMIHFTHSGWWHDENLENPTYFKMSAEDIRHYIEDKDPNYDRAETKVSPEERDRRMAEFVGAIVKIEGSDEELRILGVVRVPPDKLQTFEKGNETIIETLSQIDPNFAKFKIDGIPQIFVVFCGWRFPQEDKTLPEGFRPNSYEWSRYVFVIGK